jgi:hypothetical protein
MSVVRWIVGPPSQQWSLPATAMHRLMHNFQADKRLIEWLASNPVANPYTLDTPVIIAEFETMRVTSRGKIVLAESGMRRWPIVPEPAIEK